MIRHWLPRSLVALVAVLAACQENPAGPGDVRPLNSTYLGGGNREATDSASMNSAFIGSGSRQEGEDEGTARSPMMGGGGA